MREEKGKLIGEVLLICLLQLIMLLFRLVEPIHWPSIFPGQYITLINEFVYFGIELILVVVIVAHFIFKYSFKELGLVNIKENIGNFIGQVCFLAMSIAVAFFMSQFSKNVKIDPLYLILQIITNFITIAFLKELIFRGLLFNVICRLVSGRGIVASLITAALFACTYIPSILVNLDAVSLSTVMQSVAIPFTMGLYLSLLYYYSKNLWLCTIIHGVLISLQCLEQDFVIMAIEYVYIGGLIIYLVYKMVRYYKQINQVEDTDEHETSEEEYKETVVVEKINDKARIEINQLDETLVRGEELQEKITLSQNDEIENTNSVKVEVRQASYSIENAEQIPQNMLSALDDLHQELTNKSQVKVIKEELDQTIVMPALPDSPEKLKELIEAEKRVEDKKDIPNLSTMLNTSIEDDDLEQNLADLNTREELNKAVYLETKVTNGLHNKPKSTKKHTQTKVISLEDRKRQREEFIKEEPNFIAHLEKYLGEFEAIYKQIVPTNKPIDVLYFKGKDVDALVTNGMRGLPMNVPENLKDYENIELMMFIDKQFDLSNEGIMSEESAWLITVLTEMAIYPSMTNSYLGWGHIVGNGETLEPYDEHVDYCGALVYPPINQQDIKLCHYEENNVKVFIYNVMPLYKEELSFIQDQSSEQFVNLMAAMGINQTIMQKRINVITTSLTQK